jgi:hypothetical protein
MRIQVVAKTANQALNPRWKQSEEVVQIEVLIKEAVLWKKKPQTR